MNPLRIHLLYEHGLDERPFGSAYIRLLRPLTHPAIGSGLNVSLGLDYEGQAVDAVIVDRLWRPDITPGIAESLVEKVRRAGARLIYALDDDFLDLPSENKDWQPTENQLHVVELFLRQADGLLVTTPALAERLADYNRKVAIVPQALDERLLLRGKTNDAPMAFALRGMADLIRLAVPKRQVIGYMGTYTHDDDLLMVVPALQQVWQSHAREIEFQFIGVVGRGETLQELRGLPIRVIHPPAGKSEYLAFMPWFSHRVHWDVAIAPLRETPFNRCKSDIKFLDYCAIGAAAIYSKVPAYASTVRHGQTGWLADNEPEAWGEALEQLLMDRALRVRLSVNARSYLHSRRTLAQCAPNWVQALEHLLGGVKGMRC